MPSARSCRLDRERDRLMLAGLRQMHLLPKLDRVQADLDPICVQRDPVDELGDQLVLTAGCTAPERGGCKVHLGDCVLE